MRRLARWKRRGVWGLAGVVVVLALPWTRREIFGDRCSGHGWGLPSVMVDAVDARTGRVLAPDARSRAVLIVRDGEYVDSSSLAWGAARERAGTYVVAVRAPGYHEWRRHGVRVPERLCDIKRARLKARLRPVAR